MSTPASRRPNVIWIFGDQHRAQSLGWAGDPDICTPNIDTLADEGVYFPRAISGFPLCCPARGALLTGRYPHHVVRGHEHPFPDEQPTIAQPFRAAGYHTAYFGKWHLDGFKERDGRAAFHIVPPHRRGGFDIWEGYENNNAQLDCWIHGGEGDTAFHRRLEGYETDALTDRFLSHLKDRARQTDESGHPQPFFAALSVQPPHDPYFAPPEFMQRHSPASIRLRPNVPNIPDVIERARRQLAGYAAMIENLDWNVGRIRETLYQLGLYDDTHILFFSDHGDCHGSHGQFAKMNPYEESIRVPMIIGGGRRYGLRCHTTQYHPVNMPDLAPTSLGLCGIDVPDWMQGTDFAGCRLESRPIPEVEDGYLQIVVPTGHGNSVDRPIRGIVTADHWKFVALEGQPWLLFNLAEDPYEQRNLAFNPRYHDVRNELLRRTKALYEKVGDSGFSFPPEEGTRTVP